MRIHRTPKPIPMKIIITWSDGTTDTETEFSDFRGFYEYVMTYRGIFNDGIECKHGTIKTYAAYVGANLIEHDGTFIFNRQPYSQPPPKARGFSPRAL